ncbi:hypothetical protein [Ideonella paludis]|uniref:Uncharacterized protein n=1 Tax=Ideonella paludis TaxID=1233411 RepID=A0ABS5E072_9BURK|nr:hypothetical protein [Ideonella paludis]MBQ0936804.1 hypothetical protein [Ideonella paludis]
MKSLFLTSVATAAMLCSSPTWALESFASYDKFNAAPIDASKWASFERIRKIKSGTLNHVQRDWGTTQSDAGTQGVSFGTSLTDPSRVTQLKATVKVASIEASGCSANPSASAARARLIGTFFNTGAPVSGSMQGDVLAQVWVGRFSNSVDAPGTLQVGGGVFVCQNSDCSLTTTIGTFSNLGTATLGQNVTLQLEWDKAAKTFTAVRDGTVNSSVSYTVSDSIAPGNHFKQVATRTDTAACLSGPRTTAAIDATFDNVAVNKSAKP